MSALTRIPLDHSRGSAVERDGSHRSEPRQLWSGPVGNARQQHHPLDHSRGSVGLIFAALLLAVPALAAVEGTVVNKTTGKPQGGVTVSLTKLDASGMKPAGSAKSGLDGKFKIETDGEAAHLLQAQWQGVTYNVQVPPNAPTNNVEVAVYDALPKVSAAEVTQHMILVETDGKELVVNETVILQNDSLTTWFDPKGTFRFAIPAQAGSDLRVRATAPNGLPVERAPKKTGEKEVWVLDFAIKPGETRFDVSYKMPASDPVQLSGRSLDDGPLRLVVPQGMTAAGEGLSQIGQEPSTGAAVYELKQKTYKIALSGTGQLRAAPQAAAAQPAQEDGPRIEEMMPPGYDRQWKWALGLMIGILALTFSALYLKGAQPGSKPKA